MPFNIISLDTDAIKKLREITSSYNSIEGSLNNIENTREKSLALTHLEQSHMWLTKAIEREQLNRYQAEQQQIQQQQTPIIVPPTPQAEQWLTKAIEREQLNRYQAEQQQIQQQTPQPIVPPTPQAPVVPPPPIQTPIVPPIPQVPVQHPNLSPDAAVLAESRVLIDSLMSSIKDLTDTVAITGLPLKK